jgi:hypothetical protein
MAASKRKSADEVAKPAVEAGRKVKRKVETGTAAEDVKSKRNDKKKQLRLSLVMRSDILQRHMPDMRIVLQFLHHCYFRWHGAKCPLTPLCM